MVIKPPVKRSAIAFLAAALISACGGGGASNSGTQGDDPSGTVQSPSKVGTSPTSTTSPTATDGNAPAYGPTTDVTPIPAPKDSTTPPTTTPPTSSQGACPTELTAASGDLRAHLNSRPIAGASSEGFKIPTAAQLSDFQSAFGAFISSPSAATAQPLQALGFATSCFTDAGAGAFLLVEGAPGTGTFAVSLNPARDIWLEVPHAPSDSGTLEQGTAALISMKPRALIITGAHRCADAQATVCSGTTAVCSGTLRISDAAHFDQTFYTAAHKALRARFPTTLAVSIHAMETPGGEQAVISDGTSEKRTSSISVRLRNVLNPSLPGGKGAYSCNDSADDGQHRDLCGTTNVQGRFDNASSNICGAFSHTPSDHFLHVEQSAELRGMASGANLSPSLLAQALSQVVPSL